MERKRNKAISILFLLFFSSAGLHAQDSILNYHTFIEAVLGYHPLIQNAELLPEYAEAGLLEARGQFDPVLKGNRDIKQYDGVSYYNHNSAGINIPVFAGPEIGFNWEKNEGKYLNPELRTIPGGYLKPTIRMPLGRYLWMDEKRLAVKEAQVYIRMMDAEQVSRINELIFYAGKAWWTWWEAWNNVKVMEQNLQLAEVRYSAVRSRVTLGDLAAIDSVEAYAEVIMRKNDLSAASAAEAESRHMLKAWLFTGSAPALSATPGPAPALPQLRADSLGPLALQFHPKLEKTRQYSRQLDFREKYYRQLLLPDIQAVYSPLIPMNDAAFPEPGNLIAGISLKYPLFAREARGKIRKNEIMQETNLQELQAMEQRILAEIDARYHSILLLEVQLREQEAYIDALGQLLSGEKIRFEAGESTLFVLNRRERSLMEASLKRNSLYAKLAVLKAELLYTAGLLPAW